MLPWGSQQYVTEDMCESRGQALVTTYRLLVYAHPAEVRHEVAQARTVVWWQLTDQRQQTPPTRIFLGDPWNDNVGSHCNIHVPQQLLSYSLLHVLPKKWGQRQKSISKIQLSLKSNFSKITTYYHILFFTHNKWKVTWKDNVY